MIASSLIFVILANLALSANNIYFDMKSIEFVSNIIKHHFMDCSVFVIGGSSEIYKKPVTENSYSTFLTENTGKAIYSLNLWSNISFHRDSDIIRFSSHCSVVITELIEFNSEFEERFTEVLIPHHNEITRKDEDHYIFISHTEKAENKLLLSPLSLLIRFKLLVRSKDESVIGHTMCFYCNNEGTPKILKVDLRNGNLSELFPDFTKQFNGRAIRLSANLGVPAIYTSEQVGNQWRNKGGLHVEVFSMIMKLSNFTYTTRPSTGFGKYKPGGSGLKLPNGTWIGCVGDVLYGKADMAMNVSPNTQRMEMVTFSAALTYVSISFITSKPKTVHPWQTIFKAFDLGAWGFIGAASVFTGTIILLLDRLQGKYKKDATVKPWTIGEATFALYGSFIGQGIAEPSSTAGKINFSFWLCFTLIVGVAYVSKLTSFIMLPGTEILPRTFKQLTDKNYHFKWGASAGFRGGLGEMVFKLSSNPAMRKIYQAMELQSDDATCAKNCLFSRQACIIWDRVGDYILTLNFSTSDGKNPFSAAIESTYFVPNNWVTRKREVFLPNFNKIITTAYDTGLLERLLKKDWAEQRAIKIQWEQKTNSTSATMHHENLPKPFSIANLKGSFYLLFAGLICSFTCFIFLESGKHIAVRYFTKSKGHDSVQSLNRWL